ncbi:MAG: hypothetical protein AB1896_22110, partial [Thermodesulfobacteriota bacterium]
MPKRRQIAPLSETAFARRAADLRAFIQASVPPFPAETREKQRLRIERARLDREFFLQTYFPHKAEDKTPAFHLLIDQAAMARRAAVQVFRGGAKTTRAFVLGALHDAAFGAEEYVQYFTATDDLAEAKLDLVKAEVETNPRLHHDFPELAPGEIWRSDRIIVGDLCLDALGLGSAYRGMTDHKGRRPTKVIVDDPDEDERVESDVQRTKLRNKILKAVLPGLHPHRGKILILGTAMHPECAIQFFMNDESYQDWLRVDIPAEGPDGALAWPERFSRPVLDEIMVTLGPSGYSSEYLNQPIDPQTRELL